MTIEANNPAIEDDDLNTTVPNPVSEGWKMPEPVFRKTSGKLPQGFEKRSLEEGVITLEPEPGGTQPAAQPSISTEPTPPKSGTLKFILVALAVAAMIAFIAVFLTLLYFFFLRT